MDTQGEIVSQSPYQGPGITDVVVIDDEESICEGCRQTLETGGYRSEIARDGIQGLKLVEQSHPRVVLVDLKMQGMNGMEVLTKLSEFDPSIVSIVITGYGSIDSAVETMKIGASDFLTKPFTPEKLLESVNRGMELSQAGKEKGVTERTDQPLRIPEKAPLNKQNVLLNGLEVLGQYYSLGLKERQFFSELKYLESEAEQHAERLGRVEEKEKTVLDIVHDLRLVDNIIQGYGYKKNVLIQILMDIQAELNWLPIHTLKWVSMRLNIPYANICSITNFYNIFSLEPRGDHIIEICMGTACHVRGAAGLMERVSSLLGVQPGETDSEMLFTLKSVHCMGCCALAPVMKIDEQYKSNPKVSDLKKRFDNYKGKEESS